METDVVVVGGGIEDATDDDMFAMSNSVEWMSEEGDDVFWTGANVFVRAAFDLLPDGVVVCILADVDGIFVIGLGVEDLSRTSCG